MVRRRMDCGLSPVEGCRKSLVASCFRLKFEPSIRTAKAACGSACLPAVHAGCKHSEFECYTEKEGLASNTVFALYEDWEGSLWIATLAGVTRLKDRRFISYDRRAGLAVTGLCLVSGQR